MSQNILQVKQLTVKYNSTIVVDSIDFELKNETIVFYGPSGCGKTSILKALLNVHEPNMKTRGSILLDGNDIKKGSGEIGMTIQGPVVPSWLTIYNLCKMGSKMRRLNTQEQHDRIMSMLSSFKIDHLVDKYTHNISGGENSEQHLLLLYLMNLKCYYLMSQPPLLMVLHECQYGVILKVKYIQCKYQQ
ncbi:MAG: ABC transporter ATP-binding protein [Planctomycetes bacterium]|nr:ABC transporter ATP-binding protein [Planctomycetota bacterium]